MDITAPTKVISALKLVRDELLSTIEAAAKDIEEFFSNNNDGVKLQASIEGLRQISGTLAMIQMTGPHVLVENILAVAEDITPGENAVSEETLQSLTSAFFVLPRYLEFLENTKTDHPELLLPQINELRGCINRAPLPDSYFFPVHQYPKSITHLKLVKPLSVAQTQQKAAANRFRHMYQIGLVAILQNKPIKPPLIMMSTALERLAGLYHDTPISALWLAACYSIQSTILGRVKPTPARKRLLMNLEKLIRQQINTDPSGKKTEIPRTVVKEFVYWCAIAPNDLKIDQKIRAILHEFGVNKASYTDKQLRKEAEILSGPSLNTIHSVISVFEEEIETAKRMLELSAQAQSVAEFHTLVELLKKLAEILSVIGLSKPSTKLKEQAQIVLDLYKAGANPERDRLSDVADALLQIESTVIQFKSQAGYQSDEDKPADVAIADRQLEEAELIVLQEAETGLSLVKRALSSFSESNYDRGHIRNVAKTLGSIKGGMTLLHRNRCADVLTLAERFIEQELMVEEHPSVLQQLLETFADCIVSLEYYVTALQSDKNTDDSILQIAENSLTTLGLAE